MSKLPDLAELQNSSPNAPIEQSTPDRDNRAYFLGIINGLFFRTSQALIGSSTVLPLFVASLTDKKWLIGLGSILDIAGWFLPQIIGSYFILKRVYRLSWYRLMGIIRILAVGSIAVATYYLGGDHRSVLLPIFLLLEIVYAMGGGLSAVAFLDLVGRAIPTTSQNGHGGRGSFFGWRIFLGGIAGIIVGFLVVRPILAGIDYPGNFALLFGLATITVTIGISAVVFVKDQPSTPPPHADRFKLHLSQSFKLVVKDRIYRQYFILRHVLTLWSMGLPFYILSAEEKYALSPFWVGAFLAARFGGEMTFNVLWARLSDKGLNRSILRGAALLSLIPPVISLLLVRWNLPLGVFILVFFMTGARTSGIMMGGNNYILQHASPAKRPLYIGLTNSTLGVTLLSASFGGLIVDHFSYSALFIIVSIISIIGILAAIRLKPADAN